jgi:hypothetical protein
MHHPASWYRTSARHLTVDLGRVGALMAWYEPSTSTWSTLVLGTQQTGFTERFEAARAKVDVRHKALAEAKARRGRQTEPTCCLTPAETRRINAVKPPRLSA